MAAAKTIPLRFQRAEIELKADLTPQGRELLARIGHPATLIDTLIAQQNHRDALHALSLILPHRQVVWWGCLAARLLPDLEQREPDLAAIVLAERWVQSHSGSDAELAGELADAADPDRAATWIAMATHWAGPSIAPRGQQPVPPAPHLPGVAIRHALFLLGLDPAISGKLDHADWLDIGLALIHGENGSQAQVKLRNKLTGR